MSGRNPKKHSKHSRRASASPGSSRTRAGQSRGAEAATIPVHMIQGASSEELLLTIAKIFSNDDLTHLVQQNTGDLLSMQPNLYQIQWKFQKNLPPGRYQEITSKFNGRKTTTDMFECLYRVKEAHQYLTPKLFMSGKNGKLAEKYLEQGNHSFKNKNKDKALEFFNLAVLYAPHPPIPSTMTPSMRDKLKAPPKASEMPSASNKDNLESQPFSTVGEGETVRRRVHTQTVDHKGQEPEESSDKNYSFLANAYANRSAVLYNQRRFEKCLNDINFSIMYGISGDTRRLLERRRKLCLTCLSIIKPGETSPFMDSELDFSTITEMFEKFKLSEESPSIPEMLLSPTKRHKEMAAAVDPDNTPSGPRLSQPNENIPCLSNAVTVAYSPEKGRYLVAQRAIRPGEVLAVETCYEKSLFFHERLCCNCLKHCLIVQPCPNCSKVAFCSIECWIEGLNGDHSRECNTLSCLETIKVGTSEQSVVSLAYKIVLNFGFENLKAILPVLRAETTLPPHQRGFTRDGKYISKDFRTLYHLVTNIECFDPEDLLKKCMIAFTLLKLLIESENYFVNREGIPIQPTKEDLVEVGGTLLHFILNLTCNANDVTKWELSYDPVKISLKTIANAVFPTLSLANHSCNPTARHYFDGNAVILRATTFIQRGSEVTDNYSGSYYAKKRTERKFNLLGYNFHCRCEACVKNWGTYQNLRKVLHVKCVGCGLGISLDETKPKCIGCNLNYNRNGRQQETWWRIVKETQYAKERYDYVCVKINMKHKMTQEDLSAASNYIEVLQKNADLPLQEFCFAQETLFKMFILGV